MRVINLLQIYKIHHSWLCIIKSLEFPKELFNFFYGNNFQWIGFNIEEIENENRNSSLSESKGEFANVKTTTKDSFHHSMIYGETIIKV
jgi:uncharacterized protein